MLPGCHKPKGCRVLQKSCCSILSVQWASIKLSDIESGAYTENFQNGFKTFKMQKQWNCQTAFSASQSKWTISSTLTRDGMRMWDGCYSCILHIFPLCLLLLFTHVWLLQRMYVTSSDRPQFITTFPSTGTVSSSGSTSATKETSTSATQSSPSFCRYAVYLWGLVQNGWAVW